MNRKCQVCEKSESNNPAVTFHSFPADLEKRSIWLALLGFEKGTLMSKRPYICSDHFLKDDFQYKANGLKYLKSSATPQSVSAQVFQSSSSSDIGSELGFIDLPTTPTQDTGSDDTISIRSSDSPISDSYKPQFEGGSDTIVFDKNSSCTVTASEAEEEILKLIKENPKEVSQNTVGAYSGFRGKLALVSVPKKRKRFIGDMSSDDFSTPTKRRKNLNMVKEKVRIQRRKIKSLHTTVRRLKLKINSLNSLLKHLKGQSLISESSESAIKASLAGPSLDIFEKMLKGPNRQKYNPNLRCFALTLAFYSPKAYNFVRNTFNRSLPHLGTVTRWYRSIDGSPGFTNEALVALKLKSEDAKQQLICNLVMDEMSIRKKVEWTGSKFTGYVDMGTNIDCDMLPEAREVIVFMLVALNGAWKIPVGYFLLNGLSGKDKANLVNRCLEFLSESGVLVSSLTFDGAAANITMAEELGADFSDPSNLKTFFKHPVTGEKLFIFFDACHMVKLIRNCFGVFTLTNSLNESIKWEYITKLIEVQQREELHAATKVKLRHLEWAREKMKVRLATQVLSKSVSDALRYLCEELKLPEFQDAQATADFVLKFNDIFDILNSRNYFGKYFYKRPFSSTTYERMIQCMDEITSYIMSLKIQGRPVLNSRRKTGFLGILICIQSLKELYKKYVEEKKVLKYILTYKLSQDHLELFFGAIRSKGGFNNNPTARQFEAAYKRLLVHSEVTAPNTGNAVNLENITILCCGSGEKLSAQKLSITEDGENLQESEEYKSIQKEIFNKIEAHEYISSSAWNLTDYVEDVVSYIAGFVVKGMKKCVMCGKCLALLEADIVISHLQQIKTYGALHKASQFVVDVCQAAEKFFRFYLKTSSLTKKNILLVLITSTLNLIPVRVYDNFGDHLYDDDSIDGHTRELLKMILRNYFNIRIYYETVKKQDLSTRNRVRSINTKTILFKNQ